MSKVTKVFDSLTETFGAPENNDIIENTGTSLSVITNAPEIPSLESDAEFVQYTLYNLLKVGTEAFDDLKRIAVAEESPRSFEVLNSMLSNLSDIAVKLIDSRAKVNKIKQAEASKNAAVNNGTVNNNTNTVFVGTTNDLQDMIRKLNMDNDND